MSVSITISANKLSVVPGAEATCEVKLRNAGTIVDEFSATVLGDAGAWATVEPPKVSLFPGAEGSTCIRFRPPRKPQTKAGPVPFAVRVQSREDPVGSAAEEGTLEVE